MNTYVVIHNDVMVLIEWPIRARVFNLRVNSKCKIDDKRCRRLGTKNCRKDSCHLVQRTKILEDPGLTACARDSHATYKVQWQPERFKESWFCVVARYSYLTILTLINTRRTTQRIQHEIANC